MAAPSGSALRALALEYKSLEDDPVEGFRVKLANEEDMFLWEVALFGPPDTLYQGGYFKVSFWFWDIMLGRVGIGDEKETMALSFFFTAVSLKLGLL